MVLPPPPSKNQNLRMRPPQIREMHLSCVKNSRWRCRKARPILLPHAHNIMIHTVPAVPRQERSSKRIHKKKHTHTKNPKTETHNTRNNKAIHDAQTCPPFATPRRIPCLPDIARPPRRRRRENGKLNERGAVNVTNREGEWNMGVSRRILPLPASLTHTARFPSRAFSTSLPGSSLSLITYYILNNPPLPYHLPRYT